MLSFAGDRVNLDDHRIVYVLAHLIVEALISSGAMFQMGVNDFLTIFAKMYCKP